MRGVLFSLLMIICLQLVGQSLSDVQRKEFVRDQDIYLKSLNLSIDQNRAYQTVTIKYEKIYMAIYRSDMSPAAKKRKVKSSKKAKNKEMSQILTRDQFRLYLGRQKEIAEKYNE